MPGCPYVQLPPPTTKWLQIFHLLTQYHASVHELAGEKTMTMMKIIGENYEPETTIRFFRILEEEKYADFDLQDKNGWSAVLIALGSHDVATRAIDMLASMGVPIGRIYEDGKTALHHAASYSSKVDTLKHLYETYGLTEVNRQDQYGWTPLHYAIGSAYYKKDGHRCEKVRYLLKMGADPYIKSPEIFFGVHHSSNRPSLKDPVSPIEWAAANGPQVASQFHQDMIAAGLHPLNEENIEEVFHDALEQVTL